MVLRLVGATSPLTPKNPLDVVANLKAPVLGLYGGADAGIPLDTVDKMKQSLKDGSMAAKQSEFVVYPNTPACISCGLSAELPAGRGT